MPPALISPSALYCNNGPLESRDLLLRHFFPPHSIIATEPESAEQTCTEKTAAMLPGNNWLKGYRRTEKNTEVFLYTVSVCECVCVSLFIPVVPRETDTLSHSLILFLSQTDKKAATGLEHEIFAGASRSLSLSLFMPVCTHSWQPVSRVREEKKISSCSPIVCT